MGVMGASAAFKDCVFLENQLACTSRENCNSFNGGTHEREEGWGKED